MGPLCPETITHVQDYLRCGDLAAGFTRYHPPPTRDQSADEGPDQAWKAPEIDLGDGPTLVLEYTE